MKDVLFDGKREVSNVMVIEKMKFFKDKANQAISLMETDKKLSLKIGKELRKELKDEYENNDLLSIDKFYSKHPVFSSFYLPAVKEAYVNTTGVLGYKNLSSFLFDVQEYMGYYIPKEFRGKSK